MSPRNDQAFDAMGKALQGQQHSISEFLWFSSDLLLFPHSCSGRKQVMAQITLSVMERERHWREKEKPVAQAKDVISQGREFAGLSPGSRCPRTTSSWHSDSWGKRLPRLLSNGVVYVLGSGGGEGSSPLFFTCKWTVRGKGQQEMKSENDDF